AVLRGPHRVWMILAIIIGFVMTRVILAIVFFLIVTPKGVVMRLLGKDPLTKGPDPSLKSYWIDKEYRTRDRERLRKYY
ncbi:MAG: SxtJ family membrane protein, partial [Rhodothermales bacterium]|nr:SxtJ family membrane protein [Rhodothermales bacterium]